MSKKQTPITMLPVSKIRPNEYNPNRMTDDAFTEFVAEAKHLGRLPKPVIVRPQNDGYQIVDGEHGWRVAGEIGLKEIPCEVIKVDDFEAMRQTYKRNQHGTHNPVRLGQMFERMMAERKLSQRELAKDIEVSEGTIRNALDCAKAAKVRNSCAVEKLTVRQMRRLNELPQQIGDLWLKLKADTKTLDKLPNARWNILEEYMSYVKQKPWCITQFSELIKKLMAWAEWEKRWCIGGLKREDLRPYTRFYFEGVWYLRDQSMMNFCLELIIDPTPATPAFLFTPEQFAAMVKQQQRESSSFADLEKRLKLAVIEKNGKLPDSNSNVRRALMERELNNGAPDFIKQSDLPLAERRALLRYFRSHGDSEGIRHVAQQDKVARTNGSRRLDHAIGDELIRFKVRKERQLRLDNMSCGNFVQQIVKYLYEDDEASQQRMSDVLTQLDKRDLLVLFEEFERSAMLQAFTSPYSSPRPPLQAPL